MDAVTQRPAGGRAGGRQEQPKGTGFALLTSGHPSWGQDAGKQGQTGREERASTGHCRLWSPPFSRGKLAGPSAPSRSGQGGGRPGQWAGEQSTRLCRHWRWRHMARPGQLRPGPAPSAALVPFPSEGASDSLIQTTRRAGPCPLLVFCSWSSWNLFLPDWAWNVS